MIRFGSGSAVGQVPFLARLLGGYRMPVLAAFDYWVRVLTGIAIVLGFVVVLVIGFVEHAHGSCNAIAYDPLMERWDLLCAQLGRDPGCDLKEIKVFPVELLVTKTDVLIIAKGKTIGTFAIENPVPINLDDVNPEWLNRLLKWHTGSGAIQDGLQRKLGKRRAYAIKYVSDYIRPHIPGEQAYFAAVVVVLRATS